MSGGQPTPQQVAAARAAMLADVARGDKELTKAYMAAVAAYLTLASDAVLGGHESAPPDLDAWPSDAKWSSLVGQHVVPVAVAVWAAAYARTRGGRSPSDQSRDAYGRSVLARLGGPDFPKSARKQVKVEVKASRQAGEGAGSLRSRLQGLLRPDAPDRAGRRQLADIEQRAAAGQAKPKDPARKKSILKKVAAGVGAWLTFANRGARTESTSAVNAGTMAAGSDFLEENGGTLLKQWVAVEDNRTRPAHSRADGQSVGVDEAFTVDDEAMMYPGDPAGSPGNVNNCRCSLLIFTGEASEDEDGGSQDVGGDEGEDVGDVGIVSAAGQGSTKAAKTGHRAGGPGSGSVKAGAGRRSPSAKVKAKKKRGTGAKAAARRLAEQKSQEAVVQAAVGRRPTFAELYCWDPARKERETTRWNALGN